MTYCLAWKKGKNIFMIADTAISMNVDKLESERNSFGEIQGLYRDYYVQEGKLKIYKITDKLAISYSGDVSQSIEIIETVYNMIPDKKDISLEDLKKLMNKIENSFNTCAVELIFIFSDKYGKYIYKFSNGKFDKCDYAEIGNGKSIPYFSEHIKSIINEFYNINQTPEYYLSMIISVIQCYIMRNNTFKHGVGGVMTGVMLGNKVKWFRDHEYYIFDDDIRDADTVSVVVRNNSVFSSSDIDGGIRYMINSIIDKDMWENLYKREAIVKSLNTKNAFYYTFYSKKYNVAYFMEVNGCVHNSCFRRYVRRDKEKTHYAYMFNPNFTNHFKEYNSYQERMPSVIEIKAKEINYISHSEALNTCSKSDVKSRCEYEDFDFDFANHNYKNFDISMIKGIKSCIDKYHNIVVIDYPYLIDAIEEKINLYKEFRDFNIEDFNIEKIVDIFMKQIVEDDFDKYLFITVKPKDYKKKILNYNIEESLKEYKNFYNIDIDNFRWNFNGIIFELIKNYYINDLFFHLDKFIIISDNKETSNIIDTIIPRYNYRYENPDILLVRNLNELTNMNGELRYMVIDYVVAMILNLSIEEYGMLESLAYDI